MDIASINQLLTSRLNTLNDARSRAISVGDIEQINSIDKDLMETRNSLQQLQMLADMSAAALNANITPAEVVASGISAISNTSSIQGPSSSAFINGYDVSAYATDPLYEVKINRILEGMPIFNLVGDIDVYIQNCAPGSPVTGSMIYSSTTKFNTDLNLLIAIIQNDSSFGTLGVGARTFNPGNVGNTGYAERSYSSWADGVDAVADWLNRHRISDSAQALLNQQAPQPIASYYDQQIVHTVETPVSYATNQAVPIQVLTHETIAPAVVEPPVVVNVVSPEVVVSGAVIDSTSGGATSTAPVYNDTASAATSTPVYSDTSSTSTATSSPIFNDTSATTTSSTTESRRLDVISVPPVDSESTSTPSTATSTQAMNNTGRKRRVV
jgi:hypothetical protein